MSKLRTFIIYFSMVVSGLVIVNVSVRYLDHSIFGYGHLISFGVALTISGFLLYFIYFLRSIKGKKNVS